MAHGARGTGGDVTSGYAPVNGLQMYYEIHGAGQPLVVLPGAYMTIELMGEYIPTLARTRQVIAVELQGHGHTADIDRPITYESLADDTAALLRHLGIEQADVFGYSMGGTAALRVAMRHPALVRKLVFVSGSFNTGGLYPELLATVEQMTPDWLEGTPMREAYNRTAPNPEAFPTLMAKVKQLNLAPQDWPAEEIQVITAPTMIVIGDSDGTRPEHAVELFRLRGGGVFGDIVGLPAAQLVVLPGTSHLGILDRVGWLVPMIEAFLDAPMPEQA
ncbi:alpha/beta hydrolase [Sphaerobacter sp.]|uniref:alpha/beta fold hydrolase n=1 Tax=Sphaerobacter sp. TaxID=2099654 RepID=UPI001DB363ED|nr:alpha/beta hydrolase [Sphaerobacter sp.]MBX5446645.1 alpha/beta hydrolase [Sphaerobacter sp.]